MIFENYLTDKVKHKKFLYEDENGIKQYKKTSYIQCYKKKEKKIYEGIGNTNINETINCSYIVKEKIVKQGDLLDNCEVYMLQNVKNVGLDIAYVK